MRRRSALLCAVALAGMLAGCRPSQSERATAAVHGFLDAVARGDGAAACDRLGEGGLSEVLLLALEEGVPVEADAARAPDTCARIVERLPGKEQAAAVRRAPV